MKKEFCTYEQSLALKELGFDGNELKYQYINKELKDNIFIPQIKPNGMEVISAPLIQQAFRFFREKYDMVGYVQKFTNGTFDWTVESSIFTSPEYQDNGLYDTYEGAELGCIDHLIEVAKGIDK